VRVVELAQWVFVPVAGALLADWGADVVRIERPEGDPYRGLAVLHELLAGADVFLTNLRPGALARLGLDAESLRERYPALVYARGHGFGVRGPDADQPGYDASAFWARGGLADALTPPGHDYPIHQRGAMGDRNAAMALAFGIAGALLRRSRTGEGAVVDVSLLATAIWTLSSDMLTALQAQALPRPTDRAASPNPLVGTYRTADGRHVQLVYLQGDRYWPDLCRALGRADLADDPRFADMAARRAHAAECVAELDAEFGRRTFAECAALLSTLDAPWAPVQSVHDLLDDPQVLANGYIGEVRDEGLEPYRLPAVPVQFDEQPPLLRRAPELGEHTEQILLELGHDWEAISALREAGAIP